MGNLVVNHLPSPDSAVREFMRVLTPEGALALSTWDLPERNRFLGILVDALAKCGVTNPRQPPAGPDPYRFADDDEFRALLRGARCEDVQIRSLSFTHRVGDANELRQGLLGGSVRTAGLVTRQAPETRGEIRAAVQRLAEEYRTGGELVIPVCAKIACGRKP